MDKLVVLKPNQIFKLTRGGMVTCLTGQVRIVQSLSNIIYTFNIIKAPEALNVKQDITTDYIINTGNTVSTLIIADN